LRFRIGFKLSFAEIEKDAVKGNAPFRPLLHHDGLRGETGGRILAQGAVWIEEPTYTT